MKTSSAKAKGRQLQKFVRDKILTLFSLPEEDVVSTSMGNSGIDIQLSNRARELFPFAVECKNYARIAVYNWWKQAKENSTEELSPLLIIKQNRSEPLVIMSWETFEKLIK